LVINKVPEVSNGTSTVIIVTKFSKLFLQKLNEKNNPIARTKIIITRYNYLFQSKTIIAIKTIPGIEFIKKYEFHTTKGNVMCPTT
jgi:hypothetical protein